MLAVGPRGAAAIPCKIADACGTASLPIPLNFHNRLIENLQSNRLPPFIPMLTDLAILKGERDALKNS